MALPVVCAACGAELAHGEHILCMQCLWRLERCSVAADDLRHSRLARTLPIAGVYSWLEYTHSSLAASLLRRGKFGRQPGLIAWLGGLAAQWAVAQGALHGVDAVVPVPQHFLHRLRRGYNQAEILADELARAGGVPVAKVLSCIRPHTSQTRMSATRRLRNLTGSMRVTCAGAVAGKHIALVDDILTTGATANEAMRALAQAGVARLTLITVAAAP